MTVACRRSLRTAGPGPSHPGAETPGMRILAETIPLSLLLAIVAVTAVLPCAHTFACGTRWASATRCYTRMSASQAPAPGTAAPTLTAPETFRESGSQPGVYVKAGSTLATSVLPGIEGLRTWDEYYRCPGGWGLENGHVHTILASQWRKTANVCYARSLLVTPDGGTLALDMLKSVLPKVLSLLVSRSLALSLSLSRSRSRSLSRSRSRSRSLSRSYTSNIQHMIILQKYYVQGQGVEACQLVADDGSALADDKDFLLLLAGLGGGSDDSYVRSMGAAAHASGRWQVAL